MYNNNQDKGNQIHSMEAVQMIKTFIRNTNKQWTEAAIADFDNNTLTTFYYEIFHGKLVKFSEFTHINFDCKYWYKNNRKWFKYEEVENNLLDGFQAWNPETDLTDGIKKEILTR